MIRWIDTLIYWLDLDTVNIHEDKSKNYIREQLRKAHGEEPKE